MEIVILDALTLGSDINLDKFGQFGNLSVFQTTTEKEIMKRIKNASIIITNKVHIGHEEMNRASGLKLICVAATGYNNIDIEAAREKGIVVANVKDYSTDSVAQHTFSLILALQGSLIDYAADVRKGKWANSDIFTMLDYPVHELTGKKIGIIGYGSIGKKVAEIARAFGMQILVGKRIGATYSDIERIDIGNLLAQSDVVSIHTPLTKNSRNLITLKELKTMKPSAILINVARGGIVNEDDLYEALSNRIIRAAAMDVCEIEPFPSSSRLTELKNLILTPHIAWASIESRKRLISAIESNINAFVNGKSETINLAI